MKIFGKAKFFINYYVLGYRYNYELEKFFDIPHNKAILKLYKEGYDVKQAFSELEAQYKTRNILNIDELSFFLDIQQTRSDSLTLLQKIIMEMNKFKISILEMKQNLFYVQYKIEDYSHQSQIKMLKIQCKALLNEIQKMSPIVTAVLLRKLAKFVMEKLIFKYINIIDTENYVPSLEILKKYELRLKALKKNELKIKMQKTIDTIELSESLFEKSGVSQKDKKPKIIYLKDNEITKVLQTLEKMKYYCNNIIHLKDSSKKINFNLKESLFVGLADHANFFSTDENNSLLITDNQQNPVSSFKIELRKVIKFIVYGYLSPDILMRINQLLEHTKSVFDDVKDALIKDSDKIFSYELTKAQFLNEKEYVEELLETVNIPNFLSGLKNTSIKHVSKYIKKNILDIKEIPMTIPDLDENEIRIIRYLNDNIKNMGEYERIKFNCCLERDVDLLNLQEEINTIMPSIEAYDENKSIYEEAKNYIEEEFEKINNELRLLDIFKIVFNRNILSNIISTADFETALNEEFQKDNCEIDLLSNEINNFYLYIYLLKLKLYDEEAYKSTSGINNEYI